MSNGRRIPITADRIEIPGRAAGIGSTKGEADEREQAEAASTTEIGADSHGCDGTQGSVRK